jgi:hypothetical protein
MNSSSTNQPLACHACGHSEPESSVVVCPECMDRATCCDCGTEIQRELGVCSDNCALGAIAAMQFKIETLRSSNRGMAAALRNVRSSTKPDFDRFANSGMAYANALGGAQGYAIYGLSYAGKENA